MTRLRTIVLEIRDYAARHRATLPSASIRKDSRPLLSWRVAILPDLDQGALYRQFHLDEP